MVNQRTAAFLFAEGRARSGESHSHCEALVEEEEKQDPSRSAAGPEACHCPAKEAASETETSLQLNEWRQHELDEVNPQAQPLHLRLAREFTTNGDRCRRCRDAVTVTIRTFGTSGATQVQHGFRACPVIIAKGPGPERNSGT